MKIKIKTKNLNQSICSKSNNEYVDLGFMPTRNKGITLVALIITIIILLILAIVTIAAISKSNIIEKTKTSKEEYSIGEEKEKVTLAVQEANLEGQGTINNDNVTNGMNTYFTRAGWTSLSSNAKKMKVQILESGNIYKIDLNTGNITDGQLNESWEDNEDGSYTKEESTYKIGDTITHGQVKEMLGITATSSYKDEQTWTVIGIENGKLKLVSTENVGEKIIGEYDEEAIKAVTIDANKYTSDNKTNIYIWTFKNLINNLNLEAQNYTGINSARSITIEDLYSFFNTNKLKSIMMDPFGQVCYEYNKVEDNWIINEEGNVVKLDENNSKFEFYDKYGAYMEFDKEIDYTNYKYMFTNYWIATTSLKAAGEDYVLQTNTWTFDGKSRPMIGCLYNSGGLVGFFRIDLKENSKQNCTSYVKAIIYID